MLKFVRKHKQTKNNFNSEKTQLDVVYHLGPIS